MLKIMAVMTIFLITLTTKSFSDEVFYGVKIEGSDSFCSKVWDTLVLIKDTSPSYSMTGQTGWWTLIKRGGLKKIVGFSEEEYYEKYKLEDYSGVPGGFVKGGENTIYLQDADWTVRQYAELVIHEAIHVLANRLERNDRKTYRKTFGDSDGEEVVAERFVKEFQGRLYSDDLDRQIRSYMPSN